MASLLDKASAMLDRVRRSHLSRTVTYARGDAFRELLAAVGSTQFERRDDYGNVTSLIESRDFIITAADLILGGQPATPMPGDTISEADDGTTRVYEVLSQGTAQPWRWSDQSRRTMRIHTKLVQEAEA